MSKNQQTTLHTVNKTTLNKPLNERLSLVINNIDSVILIEDGVYQCLSILEQTHEKAWHGTAKTIYALKDDALARGIPISTPSITFIDYSEFVALSLSHDKVVSWY